MHWTKFFNTMERGQSELTIFGWTLSPDSIVRAEIVPINMDDMWSSKI